MSKTPFVWCGKTHYVEDLFESVSKDVEEHYKRKMPIYKKIFGNKEEEMTDKVKLEDMTLRQIEELRSEMEGSIQDAIFAVEAEFARRYALGQICVDVKTNTSDMNKEPYMYVNVSFYKDDGEWQV